MADIALQVLRHEQLVPQVVEAKDPQQREAVASSLEMLAQGRQVSLLALLVLHKCQLLVTLLFLEEAVVDQEFN